MIEAMAFISAGIVLLAFGGLATGLVALEPRTMRDNAKNRQNRRVRVRQDNETARAIIIAALITLAAFSAILVLSLTTP